MHMTKVSEIIVLVFFDMSDFKITIYHDIIIGISIGPI